jgi:hypothetical protein
MFHHLRLPRRGKLSPRSLSQFPILERVGPVAYKLDLPDGLTGINDVFHVSQQKKYHSEAEHVLYEEPLEVRPDLSYMEKPVKILERSIKRIDKEEDTDS